MARGYIFKSETGSIISAVAQQGTVWSRGAQSRDRVARSVERAAARVAPGLYRAQVTTDGVYVDVTVGRRVADAEAEAARLEAKAEKQTTRARTGMPGVKGYIHMENMATARLTCMRSESRRLAEWLRTLAAG